jgi:hypothetical protein
VAARVLAVGSLGLAALVALSSCRSAAPPVVTADQLQGGVTVLTRPLPGDLAALYRLRVPSSGGLRLSVLTKGADGRMTISEPFGSAASITAWRDGQTPELLDLRRGCRLEVGDVSAVIGVARLPLPQAVRLLGGRLPVLGGDRIEASSGGWVQIRGDGWSCRARVAAGPWRVVEVDGPLETEAPTWRLRLSHHTSSVPGSIRLDRSDGDWAELELVRLEWNSVKQLPELPKLPVCEEPHPPR